MSALQSALAVVRASAADGATAGLSGVECAALAQHIDRLAATTWTDPASAAAYDLTRTYQDDQGGFWHHAGWVGLPGEVPTPLMHWSASAEIPQGGIRRMADLATLPAVIDDCGPLVALPPTGTSGESGAER